jgi:hypothetical protein
VTAFYEVWDDRTGNRVGGSFATEAEAEALLHDVLRVNGPDVAREMAIVVYHGTPSGEYEPTTHLEGADFVTRIDRERRSEQAATRG